jgi:hypothetical protein
MDTLRTVASSAVTLYSLILLFCNAFLYLRKNSRRQWLSFLDTPVRKCRDVLLFQKSHLDDGYPSIIPEDERVFYDHFSLYLRNAHSAIYNCGDGFNMKAPRDRGGSRTSREKADLLDAGITSAMDKQSFAYLLKVSNNRCL